MKNSEMRNFRKRELKIGDKVRSDPQGPLMIVYDVDDITNNAFVNYIDCIDGSYNLMIRLKIDIRKLKLEPTKTK